MAKASLPQVVIVGRTNVGKSTLFNRLSEGVKSLVFDSAGVTRDVLKDTVCWQGHCFELVDTGGVSWRKTTDQIDLATRAQALAMMERAAVIIFVCDGVVGLLPEDREVAKYLHKLGGTVILAVNKADNKTAQENLYEFARLGFSPVIPLSAQHGLGTGDLLESVVNALPAHTPFVEEEKVACKVALLGRPNVGKSSLMNLLLKKERSIVADMPGTTREAISEPLTFYQEDILLTDTPGVRKKRAVDEPIEQLMVKSSLRAVEEADIILLLVDASAGDIVDQELKLAFYAFEEKHKAVILLFNKQDLTTEVTQQDLTHALEEYEHFTKKLVSLDISCKTEKNVGRILPLIQKVWERYSQRFNDDELTMLFKEALHHKPLYRNRELLHVYSAKQVKTAPITIALKVNHSQFFGPSQLAYFEAVMRKKYDLKGVPIRFLTRNKFKKRKK